MTTTERTLADVWSDLISRAWEGGWTEWRKPDIAKFSYDASNGTISLSRQDLAVSYAKFIHIGRAATSSLLFAHDFIKAALTGSGKDPELNIYDCDRILTPRYRRLLCELAMIEDEKNRARFLLKVLTDDKL